MIKLLVVLFVGVMVAEANIAKRSVAEAHMQKMKRGGDRVGMQPGDTDLCPFLNNPMIKNMITTCDENEPSGKYCILKDWQCDGEQDCFDKSDEKGCKKGRKIKNRSKRGGDRVGMQPGDTDLCPFMNNPMMKGLITVCDQNEPSGKYCILTDWQCDGEQDCFDKSDERGCPRKGRKNKNKNRSKRDGDRVGMQPGDTDLCPFMKNPMMKGLITVCDEGEPSGKYCILKDWQCDGEQDCFDKSDEKGCPRKGRKGRKNRN